ncbi:MAG: PLP-dependent aminotransferase family protein [Emcibacteraceae bacterium]|nr:PLP-dependent aminotransferase family protein [Emcibacteraceae bacterium]
MTNLYFHLDRDLNVPLHKQLIIHLKNHILSGDIRKSEKLPSSRSLATDLKVSRIVTLTAYEQLIAEGYLLSKPGSGTFISHNIPDITLGKDKEYLGPKWFKPKTKEIPKAYYARPNVKYDFSVGHPASELLSKVDWKRAWRKAIDKSFTTERPDRSGISFLRGEIANYLERTRNIKCHPDNIVITSGAAETLRLLSKAMIEFNPVTFCEKPGFSIAWRWLSVENNTLNPVNIDEDGLITSELPHKTNRPTMLFCTPSHQFPLGFRLSLKRRNEILEWANHNDALILEDDYDSEFHYDTMALPTLKSQDKTGQVVYFSSFSKSISPTIKIGYLLAPENICTVLKNIIGIEHAEPPMLKQTAMAAFIADGSLDKHIARSRRHYAKLNKIVREKLANLPDGIKVSGLDSGIHAFLSFKEMPNRLLKSLEDKSFYLPHQTDTKPWHGYALGYGHFEQQNLTEALDCLVAEINALYPEL